MISLKLMAMVLIVAGLLGLVYGSFNYTRETQEVKIGTLELSVKNTETVNIPVWLGAATMASGLGLLAFASRKS